MAEMTTQLHFSLFTKRRVYHSASSPNIKANWDGYYAAGSGIEKLFIEPPQEEAAAILDGGKKKLRPSTTS